MAHNISTKVKARGRVLIGSIMLLKQENSNINAKAVRQAQIVECPPGQSPKQALHA
jgi:hypothetical protein